MRVLSLFAGVGMFDYAWKQLGWKTVAVCEIDPWCRRVLAKHYPEAKQYEDVKDVTYERLKEDGIVGNSEISGLEGRGNKQEGSVTRGRKIKSMGSGYVQGTERIASVTNNQTPNQPTGIDLICGGFPCQDLSVAGKQAGIDGERSGLWGEFARIIGELRPRYVLIENVSALLTGDGGAWMRRVLGDLAEIGFDAEWHVIPAGDSRGRLSAGAPHRRERVWIVAYPDNSRLQKHGLFNTGLSDRPGQTASGTQSEESNGDAANPGHPQPQGRNQTQADHHRCSGEGIQARREPASRGDVPNGISKGLERQSRRIDVQRKEPGRNGTQQNRSTGPEGIRPGQGGEDAGQPEPGMGLLANGIATGLSRSRWLPEPGIGRVATGVPDRVNKLKALGNGLVWQIPYAIGQAIMEQQ